MSVGRVLVVLAVFVVAAGCSSDHKATAPPTTTKITTHVTDVLPPRTAQEKAVQACAKAVPRGFVNAKATTVGAIHAITGGPPGQDGKPLHGYAWIFRDLPDQDFAAWCWYEVTPHNFKLLVVGPSGETVDSGQGSSGGGPPGPGPFQIT
jgi:hypothetical protein